MQADLDSKRHIVWLLLSISNCYKTRAEDECGHETSTGFSPDRGQQTFSIRGQKVKFQALQAKKQNQGYYVGTQNNKKTKFHKIVTKYNFWYCKVYY